MKTTQLRIAGIVVGVVLLLMSATLTFEMYAAIKNVIWKTPDWFIDICRLTIGSGVFVLSLGATTVGRKLLGKKDDQE